MFCVPLFMQMYEYLNIEELIKVQLSLDVTSEMTKQHDLWQLTYKTFIVQSNIICQPEMKLHSASVCN